MKLQSVLGKGDTEAYIWRDLFPSLLEHGTQALSEAATRALKVDVFENVLTLSALSPSDSDTAGPLPVCVVSALTDDDWLEGAAAVFETFRRHFEESHLAAIDGVTTLALCADKSDGTGTFTPSDSVRTELVLIRRDGDDPSGYEIARGSELTCWEQFELAVQPDGIQSYDEWRQPDVRLEGQAWMCDDGRYVWQLVRLSTVGGTPTLHIRELNEDDTRKLLRRYSLARERFGNRLPHLKRMSAAPLFDASKSYRVDVREVQALLQGKSRTWAEFCDARQCAHELGTDLPFAVVLDFLQWVDASDPSKVLLAPRREELQRVQTDDLLRALAGRAEHVRYRLSRALDDAQRSAAREAIQEYGDAIRMRIMMDGGSLRTEGVPLPALVYAAESEQLRATLEAAGLDVYVGIMPNVLSTKAIPSFSSGSPFAIGASLFLDVDTSGANRK
ncbi:hypothetical protein AS149_14900 [Burkholderia cenocepacia]|nr:hypothetical protein AS149_14900 [Burkholderia cenocepacia]